MNGVYDDAETLHLWGVLMRNASQAALADVLPLVIGSQGVILKPGDEAVIDDLRSMARDLAEVIRQSDLPLQTKAYWFSMWLRVVQMTSRLIDLLPHITADVLESIPAGKLAANFNPHAEHLDVAVLAAELRAFYYSVEKSSRPQLLREFPAINDRGGWGRGLRRGPDNHGIIEPYMGTPALVGARAG